MNNILLEAVRRFADFHADHHGVAVTPIPGLTCIRATRPSELQYAISRPLIALVVQGRKRVMLGDRNCDFGAGDSLLITADVPTVSQITHANASTPYYSLVLDLDPATIHSLILEMDVAQEAQCVPVRIVPTEADVTDAAVRLLRLVDRPAAARVLSKELLREMHYWLLAGLHGSAIRHLGMIDGSARRVARAVALIRAQYAQPLRVEHLAEAAGMSPSSFHQHFRDVTSLSPLQFQKQLRLIEARRLMLSEGNSSSRAANAVGYESVSQFTREYARLFGAPPVRDVKANKLSTVEARQQQATQLHGRYADP